MMIEQKRKEKEKIQMMIPMKMEQEKIQMMTQINKTSILIK